MWHWLLEELGSLIQLASPILHTYGLWAVFVLLMAENAGVVFAPGESIVVAAGFFAAKGILSPELALLVATLGAVLGSSLAFGLGARYGHRALLRYGPKVWISNEMVEKAHRFFSRFGPPVLVIGRFVVPLRQLQGYLAGASEMPWRVFSIWNIVGAFLWVSAWGGAAFFLGAQIPLPK